MIRTIPLNELMPSPQNVRRAVDEQADLQLKADIEVRGLLQNLVVTSAGTRGGSFAVEAGGRRLKALHGLAEEGKVPSTHEVCCLVLEAVPPSHLPARRVCEGRRNWKVPSSSRLSKLPSRQPSSARRTSSAIAAATAAKRGGLVTARSSAAAQSGVRARHRSTAAADPWL